jgi:hypothetical protein
MNIGFRVGWLSVLVFLATSLSLAEQQASAKPKADGKDKIKRWQKERLEAATAIRDNYLNQRRNGLLPPGSDTIGLINKLLEVNKLVFQARLELCEGKQDRIKVLEETLKEVEPIAELCEKRLKAGAANSLVPYNLARIHLLELKIALEKVKQGAGGP